MFHFRSSHEVQTLQSSLLTAFLKTESGVSWVHFFISNGKKLGRSGTIVISTPRSGFFEPGTSRTLSENYTPKPISLVSAKSQKHCAKYRQNRKLSRIGNAKCATLPVILIPWQTTSLSQTLQHMIWLNAILRSDILRIQNILKLHWQQWSTKNCKFESFYA